MVDSPNNMIGNGATIPVSEPLQDSPHSLRNRVMRTLWGAVYLTLVRPSPRNLHRWRNWVLRACGAKLHPTARVGPRARVWAPWRLTMGERSCIADDVDCYNIGGVTIGANSTVSQYSYLCGATHDFEDVDHPLVPRAITIGASVWIAADVFVAPGVTIGDGTVVGARSSVFGDLPPWVVAVGTPAKLKTVEELIRLLDKPEGAGSGGREMTTFAMGSVSPEEAAVKLRELFVTTPEKQRPTLLTMPAQGKLLLIGSAAQAAVASGLLAELDPGSSAMAAAGGQPVRPAAESRAVIVALSHVRGEAAQAVLAKLLSPRQTAAVRLAAMPDQKGLIVSGPAADVEMVKQLVAGLDTPGQTEREVKMLRVGSGDLDQIVAKAKALYEETGRAQREPVTATIEKESRTVALVGSKSALATMTELLTSVQAGTSIDRETVTIVIRNFKPSDLTVRMQRLVRPMLEPRDGSDYVAPTIEPVDELSMLVVRASTEQLKTISDLVTKLDTQAFGGTGIDGVGPVELRSFRLRQASPTAVATAPRRSTRRCSPPCTTSVGAKIPPRIR